MKAIVTLIDDNLNVIEKDLNFEPVTTRTIYDVKTDCYTLFNEFRFSHSQTIPREQLYGYIKEDEPII